MKQLNKLLMALLISVLAISMVSYAYGLTTYFGNSTTGDGEQLADSNTKCGSRFMANATGNITRITAYLKTGASPAHAKAMVYSDDSGSPNALLGTSEELAFSDLSLTWKNFTFTTIVAVTNQTYYWLSWFSDSGVTVGTYSGTNNFAYNTDTYGDGASDPFGVFSTLSKEMCIYARIEYSDSVTPTPTPTGDYEELIFGSGAWFIWIIVTVVCVALIALHKYAGIISVLLMFIFGYQYFIRYQSGKSDLIWFWILSWLCVPIFIFMMIKRK